MEAFSARVGANSDNDSLLLTLHEPRDSGGCGGRVFGAEIRCCAQFDVHVDERDTVAGAVGAALAQKLLEVVGWQIAIEDDASVRTLTVLIPLVSSKDARNGTQATDTSERPATTSCSGWGRPGPRT